MVVNLLAKKRFAARKPFLSKSAKSNISDVELFLDNIVFIDNFASHSYAIFKGSDARNPNFGPCNGVCRPADQQD